MFSRTIDAIAKIGKTCACLRKAGRLNQTELLVRANFSRSPRERRAEIKGIVNSLCRQGMISGGGR